jgi:hypothetical protein
MRTWLYHLIFLYLFDFKNGKIDGRHDKHNSQVEANKHLKMEIKDRQGQTRQLLTKHQNLCQQAQVS